MSWRLIVFIVVFGIFLAFITVNLDNRCDVSFGFATIEGVPVFLTVFFSFVLGLLCTLPFAINAVKKRRGTAEKASPVSKNKSDPSDGGHDASN